MPRTRLPRTPINAALLGILVLALCVGVLATREYAVERALRDTLFDAYQRLFPRLRTSDPVVIVEIDERSLAVFGQWPWPRSRLAGLVAQIAGANPAVIAIDALFPEPDRYSPLSLALQLGLDPLETSRLLATIPDSDKALAQAIKAAPVILGLAGIPESLTQTIPLLTAAPILERGRSARNFVHHYPDILRNLPSIDAAAKGHGALNAEAERGILRRVPTLIASSAGNLVPGLAVEILRYIGGDGPVTVSSGPLGIRTIEIADLKIPTARNGEWWLHFSAWEARPAYSAASVLRGEAELNNLRGRIVLIGYTALGLQDTVTTPLGRMPGVEVHAEALENALEGRFLSRTDRMAAVELGLLMALGLVAILGVSYWRPLYATATFAVAVATLGAGGTYAFVDFGWLIDIANPIVAGSVVLATVLSAALGETQAQRWLLRRELATAREAEVRVRGELDAARRIQLGMLPDPNLLADDSRLELGTLMLPARAVGGDLYDFFRVDRRRLFFLIGDVSGKGLPSALFMALAKAQIRGAAQRANGNPGSALTEANRALAQDNPEMLFITAFAGLLNLDTGELQWSNAGHDSPYFLASNGGLDNPYSALGPPLCVVDEFVYDTRFSTLAPGAGLCLMTDGVTEAQNPENKLFGNERVLHTLANLPAAWTAPAVVASLKAAVDLFVGAAEQHDDITMLCLRRTWGIDQENAGSQASTPPLP